MVDVPEELKTLSRAAHLVNAGILKANDVVHQSAQEDEARHGMGSTVSVVYFNGDTLVLGNVGDSPILLIRGGEVKLVSVLHTMMAEFLAIAPENAKVPDEKWSHVLTRAMGTKPKVVPTVSEMPAQKDDIIVISSDGLSDKVEPEEIMAVVTAKPPAQACKALVGMANERGGEDNITIIVMKLLEVGNQAAAERSETKAPIKTPAPASAAKGKARIAVEYDSEFDSHRGILEKIEADHLFIKTREAVTVGEELTLTLTVENEPTSILFDGTVTDRLPGGFEVKLENLTQKTIEQLKILETRL